MKGHNGTTNMFSAQKVKLHGMISSKWTTKDKLIQYRGLINLYNRDRKIIEIDTKIQRKQLYKKLQILQKSVKDDRRELDNAIRGDKQQLRNTLADHRELQLAYQNSSPQKVIECLDQISFVKRRMLDTLTHQNSTKTRTLVDLKLQRAALEDSLKYAFYGKIQQERDAEIITGKVQDAILKKEAAVAIKHIYMEIIDIMKKDALYYNSIMLTLEDDVYWQSKLFLDATKMGQLATEYMDDRKQEYELLEKTIKKDMQSRKSDIQMLQEHVQSTHRGLKDLLRKDSDITACSVKLPCTASMECLRKEVVNIEKTLIFLKNTTLMPSYEAIYPCLQEQVKQSKRLTRMLRKCERDKDIILNKMNHAELISSVLKNTMIETNVEYKNKKKEMIANIIKFIKNKDKNYVIVKYRTTLIAKVRIALRQLLQLSKLINTNPSDRKSTIISQLAFFDTGELMKEPEKDEIDALRILPVLISRFTLLLSNCLGKFQGAREDEAYTMYEKMMIDQTVPLPEPSERRFDFDQNQTEFEESYLVTHEILTRESIKLQSEEIVKANTINDDLVPLCVIPGRQNIISVYKRK